MTSQYVWERSTDHAPAVRAADADRERIADRLRTSHADGRLDIAEFQERLDRCYRARTLGELDDLVRDLPREKESGHQVGFSPVRPWPRALVILAPILILLLFVSAAAGHHVFWVWVPLMFLVWRMSSWRHRRWPSGARRP